MAQMPADNVAKRSPDSEAWDECPGQTGRVEGEDSSLCFLRARGAATFGKGLVKGGGCVLKPSSGSGWLDSRRGAFGVCSVESPGTRAGAGTPAVLRGLLGC